MSFISIRTEVMLGKCDRDFKFKFIVYIACSVQEFTLYGTTYIKLLRLFCSESLDENTTLENFLKPIDM